MYASVATRTAEIGTLRALGFARRSILTAFLVESMLAGVGRRRDWPGRRFTAAVGAYFDDEFPDLLGTGVFLRADTSRGRALAGVRARDGTGGGVLPAAKAARMRIVDALRAS